MTRSSKTSASQLIRALTVLEAILQVLAKAIACFMMRLRRLQHPLQNLTNTCRAPLVIRTRPQSRCRAFSVICLWQRNLGDAQNVNLHTVQTDTRRRAVPHWMKRCSTTPTVTLKRHRHRPTQDARINGLLDRRREHAKVQLPLWLPRLPVLRCSELPHQRRRPYGVNSSAWRHKAADRCAKVHLPRSAGLHEERHDLLPWLACHPLLDMQESCLRTPQFLPTLDHNRHHQCQGHHRAEDCLRGGQHPAHRMTWWCTTVALPHPPTSIWNQKCWYVPNARNAVAPF